MYTEYFPSNKTKIVKARENFWPTKQYLSEDYPTEVLSPEYFSLRKA